MPAPKEVIELVKRFEENIETFTSDSYNEETLRGQFVNPFFKALGWDIDNFSGFSEAYRDVVHEEGLKVGGSIKAPDYCFRIGGTRKFFLETKRPSVNLKDDVPSAFQLRRYGWSAKLSLSILTDFEEIAVYDCRIKPNKTDKASTARIAYYTFRDYESKWDEISAIFSKEAVLKGSFDKFAEQGKGKRGTETVDDAFLEQIDSWRKNLAQNLAIRNSKLSQRELNFSVQVILDRLIFLRICEDRGIEDYGKLLAHVNGSNIYERLCETFRQADDRYNSGLFHFQKERERKTAPDSLTISLKLDDELLKEIIESFYYPESPYEFSVLPADILGSVYERFLGKIIRLTEGHRAKIEEKPEVKKAGGVFYTPTYIVDYIVQKTVGEALKGRTPKQIADLKIIDPSCGSGSFLITAYQKLLDWHLEWYIQNDAVKWSAAKNPTISQIKGGWRLTTGERKRILLNNIFGVDIDSQAVEVTKLSLLLKVLEGETGGTLAAQLRLFSERALPDLEENILCGNSLVGTNYFSLQLITSPDEMLEVNAFDWEKAFPMIAKVGFDCVIGNPPYGATVSDPISDYLRTKFKSMEKDAETYGIFMELGVRLCGDGGKIGMIVPTGWYSGAKFSQLRRYFACNTNLDVVVNLPYDVFDAWVDTTVYIATKRNAPTSWVRKEICNIRLKTFPKRHKIKNSNEIDIDMQNAEMTQWFSGGGDEYLTYADSGKAPIMKKINASSLPLKFFADVQRGVTPFNLTEKPTHSTSRPAFDGTVRRYSLVRGSKRYIRFDKTLAEPKPEKYFFGQRLLLRELISRQFRLQSVKVEESFITNKSMQSILPLEGGLDLNFLLAVINSKLLSWYFLNRSQVAQRDDFPKIVLKESRALPIPKIDLEDVSQKKIYEQTMELSQKMLNLVNILEKTKIEAERNTITRQIEQTDSEIDGIVYRLFGLTENEIAIVERLGDLN
jgi:type I restriction-modification system DNA methylase subunit